MALEFELIDWIKKQPRSLNSSIQTDIGDDMAIVQFGNEQLLITADMLLEGRHFDLDKATLEQVGYKAMACSLSDCAAMACLPCAAVVSVALPKTMDMQQAQQLYQGINKASMLYSCPVIGGDTTSWAESLAINITIFAKTDGIEPIKRNGARPGDIIMVTGQLGGSIMGHHLEFQPRIAQARKLATIAKINAMMDISDGLAGDLPHICLQSQVSAIIDADKIPISPAAEQMPEPLVAALSDGEDFELLFTARPDQAQIIMQCWPDQNQLPITAIGNIIEPSAEKVYIREKNSINILKLKGFQHF